jgi:hypothetical protein
MTLATTNEAIRCEKHAEKSLIRKKTFTVMIWEVMQDARIVLLSKKHIIL